MKNIFKRKKKPSRPSILPSGWFYVSWEGNSVIMNQRPVWNYEISDALEDLMRDYVIDDFKATGKLPSRERLMSFLRNDDIKNYVKKFFAENSAFSMAEVDFEIGIRFVMNFIKEPIKQDVRELHQKVIRDGVSSGYIIENYYTDYTG